MNKEVEITIDITINTKRTSKIYLQVAHKFWVLLLGVKNKKLGIYTREKFMPEERRKNLAETDRGSYYNQEEWVEEFLDDKGAFYNGSENDDGDNDDENYNENMEAVVRRCSSKYVFSKISQISRENTCVGVSV